MAASINILYRLAKLQDAPALQQLIQNGFRASDTRANWTGESTKVLNDTFTISLKAIEDAIKNEECRFVIAATVGAPTARVLAPATETADQEAKTAPSILATFCLTLKSSTLASFAWFVVHPSQQQTGLGRRVLMHAESFVRKEWPAVTTMELNALNSRDELIKWYERRGYVKTGHFQAFPKEYARGVDESVLAGLGFVYLNKKLV